MYGTVLCWVAWYKWAHASWIGPSNSIGIVHYIDRQTMTTMMLMTYSCVCLKKHNSEFKRQILCRTENKKCQTYIGRELGLGLLRNSTATVVDWARKVILEREEKNRINYILIMVNVWLRKDILFLNRYIFGKVSHGIWPLLFSGRKKCVTDFLGHVYLWL